MFGFGSMCAYECESLRVSVVSHAHNHVYVQTKVKTCSIYLQSSFTLFNISASYHLILCNFSTAVPVIEDPEFSQRLSSDRDVGRQHLQLRF